MILPSEYVKEHRSVLGVGAIILKMMNNIDDINNLWGKINKYNSKISFVRFILALDILFLFGLLKYEKSKFKKIILRQVL